MNELKNQKAKGPIPISTDEFDRKVEAGENVDEHFDWENAVMVDPGELSPGQKLSLIQEMLDDLLASMDARAFFSSARMNLNVSLSPIMLAEVGQEAVSRGVSPEELVRSWVEQKLDELKTAK